MGPVQFVVVDTEIPFQGLDPFPRDGRERLIEFVAETCRVGACLNC